MNQIIMTRAERDVREAPPELVPGRQRKEPLRRDVLFLFWEGGTHDDTRVRRRPENSESEFCSG